jgi:hypothetical protein
MESRAYFIFVTDNILICGLTQCFVVGRTRKVKSMLHSTPYLRCKWMVFRNMDQGSSRHKFLI